MPNPWEDVGRDPADIPIKRPSRQERIRAQIERNRRGEYVVPTWALALALALVVAGWIILIILD